MANEFSGDWESYITWEVKDGDIVADPFAEDDGKIEIVSHTPNTVNGQHVEPGGARRNMDNFVFTPIGGSGRRFRVRYRRNHGPGMPPAERRQYSGELTIVNADAKVIVRGKVVVLGGGSEQGDTGTWEATKSGSGVLREGKGKGGGREEEDEGARR